MQLKKATSTHIELFKSADAKEDGVTNIDNAKLPAGNVMLATSITILSGVQGTPTGDDKKDGKTVDFAKIPAIIANGKFVFKNGQKLLIEEAANQLFNHGEQDSLRIGEMLLEVPQMIQNAQQIILELDLSSAPVPETYIMVRIKGVITKRA